MKGIKELDNDKYLYKISHSNSNHHFKFESNKIKKNNYSKISINNNIATPFKDIKEKEAIKKLANSIKMNPVTKKTKINNDLIKSYSFKKKEQFKPKYKTINQHKNLSAYKKILDKMLDEYASDERSKDNINKLLKNTIVNQKNLIIGKPKFFFPSLKKSINNNKRGNNKLFYISGDNRSKNKRNKKYIYNVIRIQAFWRGFYFRKIVVRGLEKYYGLIFIYRLLKKYILKRKNNIFDILIKMGLFNNKRKYSKSLLNNNMLYTKKILSNHSKHNSDITSFSFSNKQNENENDKTDENSHDNNKKTFYSNGINQNTYAHKQQQIINAYTNYSSEIKIKPNKYQNRLVNSMKGFNINNNNIKNIDNGSHLQSYKELGSEMLYSTNIIKDDKTNSKIGRITTNFFKKYDSEINQPINVKSQYYFRKSIYKKANQKPKYIFINSKINKNHKHNFSSDKYKSNHSNGILYNSINFNYKDNNFNQFNNTFYNVYKFVFIKIINFIKKKVYKMNFDNFLYQLKIKRKVHQIKSSYFALSLIIQKIDKKRIKKYLDIYRANILTLRAKELIKYEKLSSKNQIINIKRKNQNKKTYMKKINNELSNIKIYKIQKKDSKSTLINTNLNNIKTNSYKKELLIKLLRIKNKFIDKLISKYFYRWIVNSNNINAKKNFTFQKIIKYNINLNNNYNTVSNGSNKITVNKKQLKIKKISDLKHQISEKKEKSLSKEKKMKIIKRISNPEEYISLHSTFNKNLKDSINKTNNNDIFLDKINKSTLKKIFNIIDKLEYKKLLYKFFIYWKKIKK